MHVEQLTASSKVVLHCVLHHSLHSRTMFVQDFVETAVLKLQS